MTQHVLTSDEIEESKDRIDSDARDILETDPNVRHVEDDFFTIYPEGYDYGLTGNTKSEKRSWNVVHAEDGVELGLEHYYDSLHDALYALKNLSK